jgi:hypothetical protein
MSELNPYPWYLSRDAVSTTLRDRDGRRIAEITTNLDKPRQAATERLLCSAPTLLVSLRFAIGLLHRAGDHAELCNHLQKCVDAVEIGPAENPEQDLDKKPRKAAVE